MCRPILVVRRAGCPAHFGGLAMVTVLYILVTLALTGMVASGFIMVYTLL